MALKWTPRALRDVERLHKFLAQKNPAAANRAVAAIYSGMKTVERQPGVGRPVEEMALEFRDWIIEFGASGYVVRYRIDGQDAVVLAARHQLEAGFS